jgi:hypothetical protein
MDVFDRGHTKPAVQGRQSLSSSLPVDGENVPAAHACGDTAPLAQ